MAQDERTQKGDLNRIASFIVLMLIILVISFMFFRVMQSFLLPLFLAALIVVIFEPVHEWVLAKMPKRKNIAAVITTSAVLIVVLAPLFWAMALAIREGAEIATRDWNVSEKLAELRADYDLEMPLKEEIEHLEELLQKVTPSDSENVDIARMLGDQGIRDALVELQPALTSMRQKAQKDLDAAPSKMKDPSDEIAVLQKTESAVEQMIQDLEFTRKSVDAFRETRATNAQSDYRNGIRRLNLKLSTLQDDLAGNFPKSLFVRLANPKATELVDWQHWISEYARKSLLTLSGDAGALVGSLLFGLTIMTIAIYYFLVDGPAMIRTLMRLSPLDDRYEEELVLEFAKVSRAVVLATLLSAVGQGLLSAIGYYFAGLHSLFLLTVLTMLLALVPFVGAAAIWMPASLYLIFFVEDKFAAGVGLFIWGAVVVSMADNLIKPYVLHGETKLHPLLALLSVLGGVQTLGPIGILVGPMLVAFMQALLKMLRREINSAEPEAT